jgi:hypothetical protein
MLSTLPLTRFVLLSTQRSGTSWFIERMAAHPEVRAYGELLLPLAPGVDGWSNWPPGAIDRPFYVTYLRERRLEGFRVPRHFALFRYLDYVFEPRRDLRAIGFKLMYDQVVRYPEILLYFRTRAVRILHLIRANVLDILLSREAQSRRSFAHARSPAELETVRVPIDTRRLIPKLMRIRGEQRTAGLLLSALRLDTFEFSYENAIRDDAVLSKALAFVGVEGVSGVELPAVMLKLAPLSHREGIANFEEVAETLRGTTLARLLRP